MTTPPHRDVRNGPGNSYVLSLLPTTGGHLWLSDPNGSDAITHEGQTLLGRTVDIQQGPHLFNARTTLHATTPWEGDSRLVLVAFTTSNAPYSSSLVASLKTKGIVVPSLEAFKQLTLAQSLQQEAGTEPNKTLAPSPRQTRPLHCNSLDGASTHTVDSPTSPLELPPPADE